MLWSVCDMCVCIFSVPPVVEVLEPPFNSPLQERVANQRIAFPCPAKGAVLPSLSFQFANKDHNQMQMKAHLFIMKQQARQGFRVLPVKRTFCLPTFTKWLFIGICQPFSLLLSGLWLSIWRWRLLWFAAIKISKLYWTEGPGQLLSPAPVRANDKVHAPVRCIY